MVKQNKTKKINNGLALTLAFRKNNDSTLALIIQIKQSDSSKGEEPIAF